MAVTDNSPVKNLTLNLALNYDILIINSKVTALKPQVNSI